MFSSFSSFSLPFGVPRLFAGKHASAVDIQSVETHNVETNHDKRARTLKHLLKLNHTNHAIVYHHLQFHNHMPHILGSAYLLGATPEHLGEIYEKDSKELEPWRDSPGEISTYDWRDYLGDKRYQRAYVDFFEDELVLNGYDWKKILATYLFEGKNPLVNNLISGLGHPLIHLGYAFELSSRELAMEALGLATTSYNFLHKYLDDPSYTQPPKSSSTTSPLTILMRIHKDSRLNDLPADSSIASLFETHEALLMEYWNAWTLPNPTKQFEESQQAAVALLVATHPPGGYNSYDFFLVHLLTTSHAVRIILPLIPAKHHVTLVRQWFLLTIAVYISQHRLSIDLDNIHKYDTEGKGWEYAEREAREGKHSRDAHFVKAVRAMKVAEGTWGENDGFWCKAAVKFAREFGGWGFGVAVEGRERRGSAGAGL